MNKLLLTTALILAATPAFSKDFTIKEVTDDSAKKQNFFSPDRLTIEPGDTVHFVNAQDAPHEVMFVNVPKAVNEMIMSLMHEKKGDTFSYTFTVPGTYKYHCHPHEAMGMEGTLIVGHPSRPGDNKVMDHHKLAKKLEDGETATAAGSTMPEGTGKVVTVDAEKHSIKLTHDPIKALNWPKMTMLFTVDSSVDLSGFKPGDPIAFTLKPVGKDDYTVIKLKKEQ